MLVYYFLNTSTMSIYISNNKPNNKLLEQQFQSNSEDPAIGNQYPYAVYQNSFQQPFINGIPPSQYPIIYIITNRKSSNILIVL